MEKEPKELPNSTPVNIPTSNSSSNDINRNSESKNTSDGLAAKVGGSPPTESMFCFSKVFSKVEQEERDRIEAANEQRQVDKEKKEQAAIKNVTPEDKRIKTLSQEIDRSSQKAIQTKGFYNKLKKTSPSKSIKKTSSLQQKEIKGEDTKFTLQSITEKFKSTDLGEDIGGGSSVTRLRVAIGTTNPGKVRAVVDTFAQYQVLKTLVMANNVNQFKLKNDMSPSNSEVGKDIVGVSREGEEKQVSSGGGEEGSKECDVSLSEQAIFAEHFESYKVSSGVSDQPITMEETLTGAKNRAVRAYLKAEANKAFKDDMVVPTNNKTSNMSAKDSELHMLSIGLESGLFLGPDENMYDVCCCAIYDGEYYHTGFSCAWQLPENVKKLIVGNGMDMSQAANESGLSTDAKLGDKGGLIALLTGLRVTRPQYTVQSIQMAVLSMNTKLYPCSKSVPHHINNANSIPAVRTQASQTADVKIDSSPLPSLDDKTESSNFTAGFLETFIHQISPLVASLTNSSSLSPFFNSLTSSIAPLTSSISLSPLSHIKYLILLPCCYFASKYVARFVWKLGASPLITSYNQFRAEFIYDLANAVAKQTASATTWNSVSSAKLNGRFAPTPHVSR